MAWNWTQVTSTLGLSDFIQLTNSRMKQLEGSLNTNLSVTVLTNVARTITVTDTWSASQTFNGGFTGGASADIAINTNKFTVTASNGNTVIGGTLSVTGVATFTAAPVFSSGTASQSLELDASKNVVTAAITGTGSYVKSASPTLTGTITAAAANFSGLLSVAGVFIGAGTYAGGAGANHVVLDINAPQSRVFCIGSDTSTNGQFYVKSLRSNDTNSVDLLALTTTSGTVPFAAWTYGSDERLKENIEDLDLGLDEVCALRPRRFDYKEGAKKQIGFVAQEVETLVPDAVSPMANGFLGLRSEMVVPLLVNAVRTLKERIEVLESLKE